MGHAKVKMNSSESLKTWSVVGTRFVSLPKGYGKSLCYGVLL